MPRSLAGQLLALLLLALAVTHVVAVLMLAQGSGNTQVHPLSVQEFGRRLASTYTVLAHNPAQRATLVVQLSQPDAQYAVLPPSPEPTASMDARETALAQGLRKRLGLPPTSRLSAHLRNAAPDAAGPPVLEVEVELPDGAILRSVQTSTLMHGHWNRVLGFSIPVALLPVMLIAILFGRRIMRPLKAVSEAAMRLSRGEQVPPIVPEGPADVRQLAESFNEMQERLGRFVSGRTRMIAAIGHDLRTPLTSLRIRAELIDDVELREAMVATIDEMGVMAEATLRFARDDAAQEPTQDVDLGALIDEVVARQAVLGRVVACAVPAGVRYRCRPVGLKRALGNLLDNAVRYGRTSVHLVGRDSPAEWRITIDDDGPGIPAEHIEQAFEPFVRLDAARNTEAGNAGLGLAIARSIVRAHGGELGLDNRPEGGLRATVSLPR